MPSHLGARPLKAWRYVGVFGPELMLCAARIRVGPARQSFWAVWDRRGRRLYERTVRGSGGVELHRGRLRIVDRRVQADLTLTETDGIETVSIDAATATAGAPGPYAWTRKQGGVAASGVVMLDGEPRTLVARAVVDDTAAYYPRHTCWRWSAGVGTARDGRELAWNLVDGVNDAASGSERAVWVGGVATEPPPSIFAPDLTEVDGLTFAPEAERSHSENRLLVRSRYRQPFGTFSGTAAGIELASGFGVMEEHDVYW